MLDERQVTPGGAATQVAILSPVQIVAALLAEAIDRHDALSVIATGATPAELRPVLAEQRDVVLLVDGTRRDFADALADVLRSLDPRTVLVVGLAADAHILRRCLDAGVRGALGPEATLDELRRAIDVVAAGDVLLSPSLGALLGRRKTGGRWHPVLTPREEEVAARLAKGASNSEIASELRVSRETVKAHVRHVLSKLGVMSRRDVGESPRE